LIPPIAPFVKVVDDLSYVIPVAAMYHASHKQNDFLTNSTNLINAINTKLNADVQEGDVSIRDLVKNNVNLPSMIAALNVLNQLDAVLNNNRTYSNATYGFCGANFEVCIQAFTDLTTSTGKFIIDMLTDDNLARYSDFGYSYVFHGDRERINIVGNPYTTAIWKAYINLMWITASKFQVENQKYNVDT
jgi:hypothetical protein